MFLRIHLIQVAPPIIIWLIETLHFSGLLSRHLLLEGLDDTVLKALLPAGSCLTVRLSRCCGWTVIATVEIPLRFPRWANIWKSIWAKQQTWANHGRNLNRELLGCYGCAVPHFNTSFSEVEILVHILGGKHRCLSRFCSSFLGVRTSSGESRRCRWLEPQWAGQALHTHTLKPGREDILFQLVCCKEGLTV